MAILGGPVNKSQTLGTFRPPQRDLDVDHMRVWVPGTNPRRVHADLKRLVADAELVQTIEGASTLTLKVRDYGRSLLRSPLVEQRSTLSIDFIEYTLVKVSHADDEITLIFEETAVNIMRRVDTPRKASRDNTTRAQFIRGMVAECASAAGKRVAFNCPELNARQPIQG